MGYLYSVYRVFIEYCTHTHTHARARTLLEGLPYASIPCADIIPCLNSRCWDQPPSTAFPHVRLERRFAGAACTVLAAHRHARPAGVTHRHARPYYTSPCTARRSDSLPCTARRSDSLPCTASRSDLLPCTASRTPPHHTRTLVCALPVVAPSYVHPTTSTLDRETPAW